MPFEIPDSWEWVRLNDLCEIARGGSPRPIKQFLTDDPNGVNWIKIGDSDKGSKYINETKEKIIPEGIKKSRIVHKGDFLLTNSMSFGRPYILNVDGCIHDGWLVLSGYESAYDKDFLFYLLSSKFAYYQFCGIVSGAVVKNLNSDKVSSSMFPLPPLSEQHRIVAKIEELLPYIDKYEQAETQLTTLNTTFPEALKKSILQEAVQGKLVPQDPADEPASVLLERIRAEKQKLIKEGKIKKSKHESVIVTRDKIPYEIIDGKERCIADDVPFEIPENWCWCRLNSLLKKSATGPFGSMLHKSDYSDEGVPLINPADIVRGKVAFSKIKRVAYRKAEQMDSYRLYTGDIVIGRRGELGRAAIITEDENGFLCGTGCFFITLFKGLDSEYFIKLLESPYLRMVLQEQSVGTTMNNLNHSILENLLIPLPPQSEQKHIVTKIKELLQYCDKL